MAELAVEHRDTTGVPEIVDFCGYDGVLDTECSVLFSDFGGSTELVATHDRDFAIWLLKGYLRCCAKIATIEEGFIGAFEGDGIMALFAGPSKEERATRAALGIQWAISNVLQEKVDRFFPEKKYQICHVAGIDTSELSACRTGVWQNYDIMWVGRAANVTANLTRIRDVRYSTYVTSVVYNALSHSRDFEQIIWESYPAQIQGLDIYRTGGQLSTRQIDSLCNQASRRKK
jgi:adenylate cyclase